MQTKILFAVISVLTKMPVKAPGSLWCCPRAAMRLTVPARLCSGGPGAQPGADLPGLSQADQGVAEVSGRKDK